MNGFFQSSRDKFLRRASSIAIATMLFLAPQAVEALEQADASFTSAFPSKTIFMHNVAALKTVAARDIRAKSSSISVPIKGWVTCPENYVLKEVGAGVGNFINYQGFFGTGRKLLQGVELNVPGAYVDTTYQLDVLTTKSQVLVDLTPVRPVDQFERALKLYVEGGGSAVDYLRSQRTYPSQASIVLFGKCENGNGDTAHGGASQGMALEHIYEGDPKIFDGIAAQAGGGAAGGFQPQQEPTPPGIQAPLPKPRKGIARSPSATPTPAPAPAARGVRAPKKPGEAALIVPAIQSARKPASTPKPQSRSSSSAPKPAATSSSRVKPPPTPVRQAARAPASQPKAEMRVTDAKIGGRTMSARVTLGPEHARSKRGGACTFDLSYRVANASRAGGPSVDAFEGQISVSGKVLHKKKGSRPLKPRKSQTVSGTITLKPGKHKSQLVVSNIGSSGLVIEMKKVLVSSITVSPECGGR